MRPHPRRPCLSQSDLNFLLFAVQLCLHHSDAVRLRTILNLCFAGEKLYPGCNTAHLPNAVCSREVAGHFSTHFRLPVSTGELKIWIKSAGAELLLMQQIGSKCFHTQWQHQSRRLGRIWELLARGPGSRLIRSSRLCTRRLHVCVPAKLILVTQNQQPETNLPSSLSRPSGHLQDWRKTRVHAWIYYTRTFEEL